MKNKPSDKKIHVKLYCKKALLLFVVLFFISAVSAQTAIPVSGGNASGEAGSLSYSVGQAFFTTVKGEGGLTAQGVQQPYEILTLTGTNELPGINLELSAYPNPVADYLVLNTGKALSTGIQNLEYRLYDMNSRLLNSAIIVSDKTDIAMEHLVPSVYFIKIISDNLEIKSFKIIKN